MKILFLSGSASNGTFNTLAKRQGESIARNGVNVKYYTIAGKGWIGYLKEVSLLRKYLKSHRYDLIHAHYSFSGFLATLSSNLPIVVSMMGSDVFTNNSAWVPIIRFFAKFSWKATIVKSNGMHLVLNVPEAYVVPNGVDFNIFSPIDQIDAIERVRFNDKKHIIFASNPSRPEKNYDLAKEAVAILGEEDVELNIVSGIPFKIMPCYMNAADVLLMTSLWEGSPNVIKEAMACNCPIVSTDVGDVREILGKTNGCYISSFDPKDIADKLRIALDFGGKTEGKKNIKHLEINTVAKKIISIYEEVIKGKMRIRHFKRSFS